MVEILTLVSLFKKGIGKELEDLNIINGINTEILDLFMKIMKKT